MALPERSAPVPVRRELRLAPPPTELSVPSPDLALRRSTDRRVVAGVCTGLGRYLDVDPWVLRGLFVVLTLGQGTGALFYLTAWLVVPSGHDSAGLVPKPSRVGRTLLAAAAVLFALDVSVGLPGSRALTQSIWPGLVILLGAVIALVGRGRPAPARSSPPSPSLARPALAAGLVVFGLAWLTDTAGLVGVPWPAALPVIVAVMGIAAIAATGRSWWQGVARLAVALVVAVSAVLAVAVPYQGGFGERLVRPPRFGALASQDEMAVGALTLDLRGLRSDKLPAEVTAGVGVGWLVVRLPSGLAVQVDGRVASGEIRLGGRSQAGVGLQQQMVLGGRTGRPRLVLHLSAGVGAVIVPSPSP